MNLAEICEALELPKGTAHRLCKMLVNLGYLARDVDERSYAVGKSLRRLALDTMKHSSVQSLRKSILTELVREVGETCNLTTLSGTEIIYLDRVEALWPLRLIFDAGSKVPLHCTASGKLLLAHMKARDFNHILPYLKLDACTPSTITCPMALEQECREIRERDYATDREEFIAGMIAVAVPVRDARGEVRAAVAMHAPTARMSLDRAISLLPLLTKAARDMQGVL